MTPEGKVKDFIKKFLLKHNAYYYMPVSNGMGAPTLDFICVYAGRAFFIEAKAPGKKPTPRQLAFIKDMETYNAPSFVVSDTSHLQPIEEWICTILRTESAQSTELL